MTETIARTVKEFCRAYGISKSLTYELIAAGELSAVKVGRRTLITEISAKEWLSKLVAKKAREKNSILSEKPTGHSLSQRS